VFVSVNAIRPQRKARTRDAIGDIRHVFLDADRDGPAVLAAIASRRDLLPPSYVLNSSPNRLHVLLRVSGFTKKGVEALQKRLARELGTDKAATSCAQVTRLPGFFNHKYRPAPMVNGQYAYGNRRWRPSSFPDAVPESRLSRVVSVASDWQPGDVLERARRYVAAVPPAVAGSHGDAATFRVCCRLVRGFALNDDDAFYLLAEWNRACTPPWSDAELRAKLTGARRYGKEPVGGLLSRLSGRGERTTAVSPTALAKGRCRWLVLRVTQGSPRHARGKITKMPGGTCGRTSMNRSADPAGSNRAGRASEAAADSAEGHWLAHAGWIDRPERT
jgi:hypothetical protein